MCYAARNIFSRGCAIISRRRIFLSHADSAENAEIFSSLTQKAQTYTEWAASQRLAAGRLRRVYAPDGTREFTMRASAKVCEVCVRK